MTDMSHINILTSLPDSPKVALLARLWKCSTDKALGRMVRWLCWLDEYTTDGKTNLLQKDIDSLVFRGKKYTAGLIEANWAAEDKDGLVYSVDFAQYNGPTAKRRMIETAKKRLQRAEKTNKK